MFSSLSTVGFTPTARCESVEGYKWTKANPEKNAYNYRIKMVQLLQGE